MTEHAIFPLFYLPPVSFFTALKPFLANTRFEIQEHFPKQTYRNRASIYAPNGKLNLTIPVEKGSRQHTSMKDVKISYNDNWQRTHWMSLQTCYRTSAYFEYYEADFEPFYQQKFTHLADFNTQLLALIFKCLKWNIEMRFTSEYHAEASHDFRSNIHPKKDMIFDQKPYYQLFQERYGFLKDLSILDLLFNKGPQSQQFI